MTLKSLQILLATYPRHQEKLTVLVECKGEDGRPVYLRLKDVTGAARAKKTTVDGKEQISLESLDDGRVPNVIVLSAEQGNQEVTK